MTTEQNQQLALLNNDGADSGAIEVSFCKTGADLSTVPVEGINVSGASALSGDVNDTCASRQAAPDQSPGAAPIELATCALCFRQGVYGIDIIEVDYHDWLGHDTIHCECKDYEACLDRRGY
jgi:hypothetical protein